MQLILVIGMLILISMDINEFVSGEKSFTNYQNYNVNNDNSGGKIGSRYTKEILIKQGRLKGVIKTSRSEFGQIDVEQYLGVPYAEAPIGSKRFMPPGLN